MPRIRKILEELKNFDGEGTPVLSLYLTLDPSGGAGMNLHAQLGHLAQVGRARVAPEQWPDLEAELRVALERVLPLEPTPRGLAVFSCAPRGLLRAVPLEVRLRPSIQWGTHLDLRQLLAVIDEHEPILAVLLDKERARFFRAALGETVEIEDFWDYVPNHHQQGGYAQANIQRDHDEHVQAHVHRVAAELERLDARDGSRRILAGAPVEALGRLRDALPAALRARFHSVLHLPVTAPTAAVGEAVEAAAYDLERAGELQLLDSLGEAQGQGAAVSGAEAVLEAVNGRRVLELVLAEGLELDGGECSACGLLYRTSPAAPCPVCGAPLNPLPDLLGPLVLAVLRQGGEVEEVRGEAAARLLALGGIAALLRYPGASPTAP